MCYSGYGFKKLKSGEMKSIAILLEEAIETSHDGIVAVLLDGTCKDLNYATWCFAKKEGADIQLSCATTPGKSNWCNMSHQDLNKYVVKITTGNQEYVNSAGGGHSLFVNHMLDEYKSYEPHLAPNGMRYYLPLPATAA